MNIIVCIKQVLDTDEIQLNPDTNTIVRENVKAIINPFDTYALEEGLRIKENIGIGKVIALSMGIPSVTEILREAIGMGVDDAILLSDTIFAGSDTLATAYILSMGIKKIGKYDLIICGKQAIDGDTAQVGPSLAEKLGIPHVTNVKKIEEINKEFIRCQRLTENGYDVLEIELPALITVVKDINEPRMLSLKGAIKAKKAFIEVWNAEDVEVDRKRCGLTGSPTKVVKTYTPVYNIQSEFIKGEPYDQAKKLVDKLFSYNKLKIIK
ncbi:electron transfer flavoprotein subunit beta/FixA family protein [Paramaledivibacter caminithermalis]|jgi:electron transfer flavoprotein beta subunit|uniref:Electron transfer flavoprotein small subunit n=1 Tax=Paramaledivibacter caminithermalis (strain DSM 15212 / CIP 107654 / DViRD3) TaxID=1121301 RepID=A0A1M6QS84_PARC5|nr:electron transfer flavoprotein subunit beta/FixA family protein [Paramaledivibacter caminithermalis]SHK22970.1 electron transfer flavoprotein beta subunit [Paramaledivibacter caminithermalis DSM 15212]